MKFSTLKKEANQEFLLHFRFYLILFLPYLILQTLNGYVSNNINVQLFNAIQNQISPFDAYLHLNSMIVTLSNIITILGGLIIFGISFQILDLIRQRGDYQNPFAKSTGIFGNRIIWGVIGVWLLQTILIILWTFVFIIPGLVKSFSYSQAVYIYRDAVKNGQPISPLTAITRSRQLMDGHKMEFFLLQLSFIGWFILLSISTSYIIIPILGIYIYPYFQITTLNYYNRLLAA